MVPATHPIQRECRVHLEHSCLQHLLSRFMAVLTQSEQRADAADNGFVLHFRGGGSGGNEEQQRSNRTKVCDHLLDLCQ